MRTIVIFAAVILSAGFPNCTVIGRSEVADPAELAEQAAQQRKGLRAFRSDAELRTYLASLRRLQRERAQKSKQESSANGAPASSPADAKSSDNESVTNVQHAGVDEGGIVKVHGNHLVVLRRGRLFTVSLARGDLRPASAIDAFAPDIDPSGTWYDEMLISGDNIAVIGYSYQRGGTEIGLFKIDGDGRLSYNSTYHLRSNDYYSSRNYASRLIGQKLIFYTPSYLLIDGSGTSNSFPALRRWRRGALNSEFRTIAPATRVYRAPDGADSMAYPALHSVTVCDLGGGEMACESTSLIGPPGNVFYVSPKSVYVWTTDWYDRERGSTIFRMPLDGSRPSALKAMGSPTDQFSFLESEDGYLNVLLRSNGYGNWMWGAEHTSGDVALMRVPAESFADGTTAAPDGSYRRLPRPKGNTFQNRFVGDHILYGTGTGWGRPQKDVRSAIFAAPWRGGEAVELSLPHGVDRIEALGSNAIAVGTDGEDLHFTGVRLGERPRLAGSYVYEGGAQGETRSHGFFYKPEGADSGLLGLPVQSAGRPGYSQLFRESASVLFVRNDSMNFHKFGELVSRASGSENDGCRASCVDWYGNSRPLFLKGRIFALLGYEMVEGVVNNGRIDEKRRINLARTLSRRQASSSIEE